MPEQIGYPPGEVNDDIRKQKISELSQVRDDLSAIMAEDFKDFQGPRMVGPTLRMSPERLDRSGKRTDLQMRENRLMSELREQTGGPIDGLV